MVPWLSVPAPRAPRVLCTPSTVSRPCWGGVGGPKKASTATVELAWLLREQQAASANVVKKSKRTQRFSCEHFNANNTVLLGLGTFYYLFIYATPHSLWDHSSLTRD